jgi:hypothetical protein
VTSSRERRKGTGGESELRRYLADIFPFLRRTPASANWDLEQPSFHVSKPPLEMLATRPDNGRWLVTMDVDTLRTLVDGQDMRRRGEVHIEVKRHKAFALHSIWESKFGKGKK